MKDADHIGEGDEKEVGAEEEVNDEEASGDAGDRYDE